MSKGQVLRQEHIACRQYGGTLQGVLQLTDITGPGVGLHDLDGFPGELEKRAVLLLGDAGEEILCQQGDVLRTSAERRQMDTDDIETVIEILAEFLLGDGFL